MDSIGTWIVILILAAIITLVVWKLVKDKRNGKSSCGCNCGCCPNSQLCHSKTEPKSK
ncbi:FeoB-associated Cys-rich membrane protein [uncultured Ruminococcus sp.]|uniref:FeoB-associated Cys-rich membrane protein n=1 Tax=uncultured Ruminococcus sp. TaxID=165186 RepID=UPI002621E173|nr:FeoB-associated Cys-rich membrane protein [uncultured Ruminococcus sp.]